MSKKRISIPVAVLILLTAITNCYSQNISEVQDSLSKNYPQIKYDNSKLYSEDSRKFANELFSHYLSIKNAFANDNSADAQKHALELMDAIDLAMPKMSGVNSDTGASGNSDCINVKENWNYK